MNVIQNAQTYIISCLKDDMIWVETDYSVWRSELWCIQVRIIVNGSPDYSIWFGAYYA